MINLWTSQNKLWQSRRANGKLIVEALGPAKYYAYCKAVDFALFSNEIIEPDFPGWYRITFADWATRMRALEIHKTKLYEADISPVRRYFTDTDGVKLESPRRAYLDIETDSRIPPRVQATEAPGRMLSWAVVDEEKNEYVNVLDEDSDEDEVRLLSGLWDLLAEYDQVPAWFGSAFDFPVIEMRTKRFASRFARDFRSYFEHGRRLLFIDHAACFKRHHMAPESGDDKTSMKLNDVCQAIIGEGKHDFAARKVWDEWAAGGECRQRMVDYNLQDTRLLPKLEAATGYLELQQTLAEVSLTPASSHGLKPMPQVDGLMLREARAQKTHLPSKSVPTGQEPQYTGALVVPPEAIGIHEMVHVCDFKSLYPTVIRSLNISPEMKGLLGGTAFGTNVTFGCDSEGMLAACCRKLMEQRDFWKKKAKADPNDKYAERMNKAFKIACNSIYGVIGSVWSRYYDTELAESVTLGAQAFIRATIAAVKDRGWRAIYTDTDSVFVVGPTVDEFRAFCDWCNKSLYPKMLADAGFGLEWNCIELDYEKCFRRLVFPLGNAGLPASKRYFGSYEHYAFKPKTKPEIRGLEYMRGDGLRLMRHLQHEAIHRILDGATSVEMEEWVRAQRHRVMTEKLPIEEIVQQKGLGQELAAYKTSSAHVRLARELEASGEDVGQGTRIPYVITNGAKSPLEIIHADKYDGTFDRYHCWNKQVYPALQRVLAGAYQDTNWLRWYAKRPAPSLPGQLALFS